MKAQPQQADESEKEPIGRLKDFLSGAKNTILSKNHIILLVLQVRITNCLCVFITY